VPTPGHASRRFNPRSPREERPARPPGVHPSQSFNPRSPREERLYHIVDSLGFTVFQSTLPSRGATLAPSLHRQSARRFNPRSPREERRAGRGASSCHDQFQSTLPSRGATLPDPKAQGGGKVSIHAPLARSDDDKPAYTGKHSGFNPRSPREERLDPGTMQPWWTPFQSTLPSRGATPASRSPTTRCLFQSTLPSRGATGDNPDPVRKTHVSIHAPLARSDWMVVLIVGNSLRFNPRSPREERRGDEGIWQGAGGFNPRSPREERPLYVEDYSVPGEFQSTLPSRGATDAFPQVVRSTNVSIHAPLARSDILASPCRWRLWRFNPRSPREERPDRSPQRSERCPCFNPRSPREERHANGGGVSPDYLFQSTLPSRGATNSRSDSPVIAGVSIHAPLARSDPLATAGRAHLGVSIHAPLARSDGDQPARLQRTTGFNPRSPREERLRTTVAAPPEGSFNPRSPREERPKAAHPPNSH